MCFNSAFIVNNVLGSTNGFREFEYYYWSSTEDVNLNATSALSLPYGDLIVEGKNTPGYVRAVRRF